MPKTHAKNHPRIGLVLGGGGETGVAYMAGVVAALHDATGWHANDAEIVVGTSAGSLVGTTIRVGVSPSDMHGRMVGAEITPEGAALLSDDVLGKSGDSIPLSPELLNRPLLTAPELLTRAATRPWGRSVKAAAAGVVPSGPMANTFVSDKVRKLAPHGWPPRDLWIVAVRMDEGKRTVFGNDSGPRADLPEAVAASCAIPGFFTPVQIDGIRYIDGGIYSATNADLLAGRGLDLVIVCAPFSMSAAPTLKADSLVRRYTRYSLMYEAARLRRRGTKNVMAFEPTPEVVKTIGVNIMDVKKRPVISAAAREAALAHLDDEASAAARKILELAGR